MVASPEKTPRYGPSGSGATQDSDRLRDDRTASASRIMAPIPLLAFLGATVEIVLGTLAYSVRTTNTALMMVLAGTAVVLVLVLFAMIYRLLTKYYPALYTPQDYNASDDFFRVFQSTQGALLTVAESNEQEVYRPYVLTDAASDEQLNVVKEYVQAWDGRLRSLAPTQFSVLHSWYNEQEEHNLALLCLDIAIARGLASSKNYGFRASSLRKIGRLREARSAALLALDLDASNADAHYNLARVLREMGDEEQAREHASRAIEIDPTIYRAKLEGVFPPTIS